jgi:hypothetical protein
MLSLHPIMFADTGRGRNAGAEKRIKLAYSLFVNVGSRLVKTTLMAIYLALPGIAQTQVDLAVQSRAIDFSGQLYTKPVKTGALLPAICAQGELFFLTSAPPGANIYVCPATNTWAAQSGVQSCATCTTNSVVATVNAIMLGAGGQAIAALASLGTASTVLHGNATGAPTFGAVNLAKDVTGNLTVANLNGGQSASGSTFWRGDGTWATPAGSGTVTHTGGALTLNQLLFGAGQADAKAGDLNGDVSTAGGTATTLATVNATPGACGDSSHVCAVITNGKGLILSQTPTPIASGGLGTVTHSAGALPLNLPVVGNGAGDVATGTTQGNTTKFISYAGPAPAANDCAKFDASGNLTTNGVPCGSAGTGAVTVAADGTNVGTRGTLNFVTGSGLTSLITDVGGTITIQQSIDTALIQTRANQQAGTNLYCSSASASSTAYTCAMSPSLTVYTAGMIVQWKADVNAGVSPSLNIDTLGAKAIMLADGVTVAGPSDIAAGQFYALTYDGTKFRLPAAGGGGGGSTPAAVSASYWPFGGMVTFTTTETVGVANRVHYYEFIVPYPGMVVSALGIYTNFAAGDQGAMAWGIYSSTCTLLANSTTFTGTGNQNPREFTFTPVTLAPGKYFVAFTSDITTTQFYGAMTGQYAPELMQSDAVNHVFYGSNLSTTTAGVTTLPATCGTKTAPAEYVNVHSFPGIVLH